MNAGEKVFLIELALSFISIIQISRIKLQKRIFLQCFFFFFKFNVRSFLHLSWMSFSHWNPLKTVPLKCFYNVCICIKHENYCKATINVCSEFVTPQKHVINIGILILFECWTQHNTTQLISSKVTLVLGLQLGYTGPSWPKMLFLI